MAKTTTKATKKKRIGRPPATTPRTDNLHIRLLPDEAGAFREAAEKRGMSVSAWMRQLARDAAGLET